MDLPRVENKRYQKDYPMKVSFPHTELLNTILNKTIEADESLPDDETKYYRRTNFAWVSFVGELFGILLEKLEELGLPDSTIVVFLVEHCWHFVENNIWEKSTTFEQGNHTSLVFKIPGLTNKGVVSDALVETSSPRW